MYIAYGSGRTCNIIEELFFPFYFENKNSEYHVLLKRRL
jgi:hypothetical protein